MSAATVFEFEGVEKKLEIDFFFIDQEKADPRGLRTIPKTKWVEMLKLIKCAILSEKKNDYFDAYLLSESSLFVYPNKVIVKTCGTTRTLLCLGFLLGLAKGCNLAVEFVFFSRKNFKNPQYQHFPHNSFDVEIEYLNKYFTGTGYTLGSSQSDHWNLYIADYTDYNDPKYRTYTDQTIEIMMTDLDREVMKQFYKDPARAQQPYKEITVSSGIADILPGAETDEFCFDPCGYSVNGFFGESYFTIHVTPEPSCSFVSFETNAPYRSYEKIVNQVVEVFKPGNFQVSLFIDHLSQAGPQSITALPGKEIAGFRLKDEPRFLPFEYYNVTVSSFTKT